MWVLGLAVPVTASYIIAAVMVAPALTQVGVAPGAAHMFIFYYAVLSEVSPPTALSPFAAAAITGGNPFRTTMISWKYTAPAFVVPFVFTLESRRRRSAAAGQRASYRFDLGGGGTGYRGPVGRNLRMAATESQHHRARTACSRQQSCCSFHSQWQRLEEPQSAR